LDNYGHHEEINMYFHSHLNIKKI